MSVVILSVPDYQPPSRFLDVEAMVLTFLGDNIDDAAIVTSIPEDRPSRFVRLWRNGGPAVNRVMDRPILTIEAWDADTPAAAALANRCRNLLLGGYTAMRFVRRVEEITGPYAIADEETESPRYRFSVALIVRAAR